jgi:curved DNA-binding protein CbpA
MSERSRSATIADFVERAYQVLGEIDYYQILGLARDAGPDAVRAAYYRLAARLHPDTHGDEIDPIFKQKLTSVYSRLVEAYRVLSNPAQREPYDAGLADGEMRLSTGVRLKVKPEDAISDPGARRFYVLGVQALNGRDPKSAVMNLRMALSRESCPVIQVALADAEAQLKAGQG